MSQSAQPGMVNGVEAVEVPDRTTHKGQSLREEQMMKQGYRSLGLMPGIKRKETFKPFYKEII